MKTYITRFSAVLGSLFAMSVSAIADTSSDSTLSKQPGVDITIQGLVGIVAGLACWATRFVMIIMVVMIVWYGFQMMIAQGVEAKFTTAKKSLTYAVVGIAVILGAYTIIATVGNAVVAVGQKDLNYKAQKYTLFVPFSCGGY
jgi:crotonobetainyl-CoA:carnitine CoA-transferase CaiB-like acyl-CoA transferase